MCSQATYDGQVSADLKMKTMNRILILVISLVFVGCAAKDPKPTPAVDLAKLMNVLGSQEAIDAIQNATTVRAFRFADEETTRPNLDDYKIAAGPVDIPDSDLSPMKKLFLDATKYHNRIQGERCGTKYNVRLEFIAGEERVDVLICFSCGHLRMYHNRKVVFNEKFETDDPTLAGVLKKLFTGEAAIFWLRDLP
jgi:hypothetical protein